MMMMILLMMVMLVMIMQGGKNVKEEICRLKENCFTAETDLRLVTDKRDRLKQMFTDKVGYIIYYKLHFSRFLAGFFRQEGIFSNHFYRGFRNREAEFV